jgi:hypothetical protein
MIDMVVRLAKEEDLPELENVEKQVWTDLGTEVYGRAQFESWLSVNPACFLVAESRGRLVGYVYGQIMNFSVADIPSFVSCEAVTDHGHTRGTHNSLGDSLYGMSVASIQPGAGKLLIRALYQLVLDLEKKCYFAFPRISGFDHYCRELEQQRIFETITPALEAAVALWYTVACAKLEGHKVWNICPMPLLLPLPPVSKPDPVFNWHLRHWHLPHMQLGVVSVLHQFMPDPESRDYTVFICSKLPGLE